MKKNSVFMFNLFILRLQSSYTLILPTKKSCWFGVNKSCYVWLQWKYHNTYVNKWPYQISSLHPIFRTNFISAKDSFNKSSKALKVHSVIYWSIYTSGHRIFRRNMSQMYTIALLSSFKDQIWLYVLFSKHSYTTFGFGGHIRFVKKTIILWVFWH